MKEYNINKNDSGQRVDKFMGKVCPALPTALLYKYIRIKRIKVNGKRCEKNTRLMEGDFLQAYINDEFFEQKQKEPLSFLKLKGTIKTVYEDDNLIVLDKPAGLVVHEDDAGTTDTLIARVHKYLYESGEYDPEQENSFVPALCNRIDRNTSGLVIVAKNAAALRVLNQKIKDREIKKYYLCLVKGQLKEKKGRLTGYLTKDASQKQVSVAAKRAEGAKTILTNYCVKKEWPEYSLVEVELLTGRTHQIRAHFASIQHPLVGDGKYGDNTFNKKMKIKYQALTAYKLIFSFQTPAGELEYLNGQTVELDRVWFLNGLNTGQ